MRWAALVLLWACGPVKPAPGDGGVVLLNASGLRNDHLATCDDPACGNGAVPPLGGSHCATWLPCRKYEQPQPRCSWLHNMEHGHLVLAWNCPQGCPELVAQLGALFDEAQADVRARRTLVTEDQALPGKVGAFVWGWGWVGDTVDREAIAAVRAKQDVDAPEPNLGCQR